MGSRKTMRPETSPFIYSLSQKYTFPEPIVDLGGCETDRQFKDTFRRYEIWDRRNGYDVDRVIDVTVPLPREAVGYAASLLCIDTLEHIWDFRIAVKNIGSIVKQNGLLVIITPFAFPYHDVSGDFWRFTHRALERLFSDDFNFVESGYTGDQFGVNSSIDGRFWGNVNTSAYFVGTRK